MNTTKKSIRFGLRHLSSVAKHYLLYLATSLFLLLLTSLFFVAHENMLCGFTQMLVWLNIVYLLIAIVRIGMTSHYNRERNLIISIIPVFMTTIGCLISFWIYVEIFSEDLGLTDIILALLALLFFPVSALFLNKTVGLKSWAMYLISLGQIIISGLIVWLEILYCF